MHFCLLACSSGLFIVCVCVCYPVISPSVSVVGERVGVSGGDITKMDDTVKLGWCLSQCKHFLLLYYHYHG